MKTNLTKAAVAGLTALVIGNAAAQESVSKPVGYETLSYTDGFNYLGLRLHEAIVVSGSAVTVSGDSFTVESGLLDTLVDGTTYILEVISGDSIGAVVIVDSFDSASNTASIVGAGDFEDNFQTDDEFQIRPAATLASVFGTLNDVANAGDGLASTSSFGLSDQVWVPDGLGGFSKYAFVQGNLLSGTTTGWKDSAGLEVTPSEIPLIFTDGVIINAVEPGAVVVSGSVKLEAVAIDLSATFNYVGGIYPVGLTLTESSLENTLHSVSSFGLCDQVWLPDGNGGFDKYAYVQGNLLSGTVTGWRDSAGNTVDGSTVSFDDTPGVIINRARNEDSMVLIDSPDFYDSL